MTAVCELFTLCRDDPDGAADLLTRLKIFPQELNVVIGFQDENGTTPLYIASQNGYYKVVKLLLAVGADKDAVTKKGKTPLYIASKNGHLQVGKVLLAAGSDKDAASYNCMTSLLIASQNGYHQVVEMLLTAGADKNAAQNIGATPLYIASQEGHHQVVEVLLAAGADKDTSQNTGATALYIASEKGHHQVVEMLLTAGANKDASDNDGWTPLHIASQNGHHQVVGLLISAGADKDAANNNGATPLYIASHNGHHQVVEMLLTAGANKNAIKTDKWTSLHAASGRGYHRVVELLLAAGADKDVTQKTGATPLFIASGKGNTQVVELLLMSGADRDAANNTGLTPLHIASLEGHHQVVEVLLAEGANKNAIQNIGATPLYIASQEGHHQVVEVLLAAGANKDAAENTGATPLYIASQEGHHQIVEVLLAAGADKNVFDNDGRTPLCIASRNGHHQVVAVLLMANANKDASRNDGATPLYVASYFGHCEVVEMLLTAGADKDVSDNDGWTPLHIASQNGHHQVVGLLISAGADKDAVNNNGATPLYIASHNGHHQVVEMLLTAGANKNAITNNGRTSLFIASQEGFHQVVEAMVIAGADKNASENEGRTPLYIASQNGHHRVVKILLSAEAEKNAAITDKSTPLHIASQNGHHQVVEMLLTAGAYKDAVSDDGRTPLYIASRNGHHQVVEMLLAAGADREISRNNGMTPLSVASYFGHCKVVELLMSAGTNKDASDNDGWTPLHFASQNGHHQVAEMLLTAGADKNVANNDRWTPLFIASEQGHHQVVEVLLAAGADKDTSQNTGATALYIASEKGHHQVVEMLLMAGANKDASDNDGWTPLLIASEQGHHQVVEMLVVAGANMDISTKGRRTALFIASQLGHHQVAEVLLAVDAHKDISDNEGRTPLYIASEKGFHLIVEMLLAAGAEKEAVTQDGRTSLYAAASHGHNLVVRHLLSVGADKFKKFNGSSPLDIARSSGNSDIIELLSNSTRPSPSPLIVASLVRLNRVKLMVVGRAAVGKTTLVRTLFGKQLDASISSTDGIDLGQFSAGGIEFITWDFGGQKVYRYTHQLFLSGHAVYLMLFKASDPVPESLKEMHFWLNSISARISNSVVLLVGTHVDKVGVKIANTRALELLHIMSQEYPSLFQAGQRAHMISANAAVQSTLKNLLEAIIQAGQSVNFPAPKNYASALSYMMGLQLSPPVIDLRSAIASVQARLSVGNSDAQILNLLKAFHTLGLISVFHNEQLPSLGVIVLRPQWIAKLLATIVTTRHSFVNTSTGVLSHSALVNHLWTDHAEFPPERHQDLINLLVQLDIFFPLDPGEEYFVPCMLREETPDEDFYLPIHLRDSAFQLNRVMELECAVPISVIPPIMVELLGCGELRVRWQQGCVVRIPASKSGMHDQVWLQLWRSGGRKIELKVWGESIQTVTQWLRRICSRIDSRLREFYHVEYRTLIPCSDCLAADSSSLGRFTIADLRDHVLQSHTEAACQPNGLHRCRLDMMVPDLLFLDLSSRGFVVPLDSLTEIYELGQGAFGKVLKMSMAAPLAVERASTGPTCSSKPTPDDNSGPATSSTPTARPTVVAVKFLGEVRRRENQPGRRESEPGRSFFEDFKHEVYLMSSLDDPNVVKLSGICLQPKLAMVMELVEGGNLYDQLNDPFRLKSRVFGLVTSINAAFSDFNMNVTFRHVFFNRYKLAPDDREQLEARIVGLLAEPRTDSIRWIQEQIDQNSRNTEFTRLTNSNPLSDLGLTAKQLELLGMPKTPLLATLGDGALKKAQQAFLEWKDYISVCGVLRMIENLKHRFFKGVEELFAMQVAHASWNDIRKMTEEQMREIEDGIQNLSKEQALLVAPVDEALRLKLAIDIARGMVHLHELNPPIVHRDLKTPNIFLTRSLVNFPSLDGDVECWRTALAKVGDFGLSLLSLHSQSFQIRNRAEDDPLLNLNATWAAPELLSGGKYSMPVDVYAMGIILWELLLRQHPFSEIHQERVRSEVMAGRRPVVPAAMAEDSNLREYIELMMKCWHQNSTQRPSMREVYDSLRDICQARCPALDANLPPPPLPPFVPRGIDHHREHGTSEFESAPTVTSHSFPDPAESSASQPAAVKLPRVVCMLAALKQQEVLWLGLESGYVALVDYRHRDPQREMLRWIQCQDGDRHQQRVNAISHLHRNSDQEGTMWTGSEDGSIHVWSPQLRSLDEIYDANTLKGRLEYLARWRVSKKYASCWVECEHGAMTWYEKRHDLKPIKSLPVALIRSVSIHDSLSLSIVESSGKIRLFRQPENDQGGCGVAEWHRVLTNIMSAQEASSRGITRLAAQRQSQQAILALERMDHTMWSANAGFLLTEWELDNMADHHGLHRTMQLRPLRSVQLDGSKLETARLRTIGGFVRVAASVLWVAVGDRWVVLDVTAGSATWQEQMVEGMDKIAAVASFRSDQGQEVWTIDCEGRRIVWRCGDAESPEVAGELVDEGWGEGDGRGYCMVQVGGRQMLMGTSQGRVLSWDASSRHLAPQQLQPLPASHPLAHSRSVHALVSIPGAQPPIVWSASRDQTLRRFSW